MANGLTKLTVQEATNHNDVMFDATEIPNAVLRNGGCSKLSAITIIDKDSEQVDMDIIFMQVQTNFGTADSASDITDANLQSAKVLGSFMVDWTDHHVTFAQDANNASIWHSGGSAGPGNNGNAPGLKNPSISPLFLQAADDTTSVYFTAIVNDTNNADYAAVDDLEFVFHVEY